MTKHISEESAATLEKRAIEQAQAMILNGIKRGWPEFYVEPPAKEVTATQFASLSDRQIDNAVRALVLACNLSGGSTGNVQLYELLRTYLHNPLARVKINDVVSEAGKQAPAA
ncbi:hypothetical protein OYT13_18805 [Pandoraea sp. XJJ-1]|uniref:hypothetical protein n=1 Tax=Pandoraea sp. XJJ-1 TaxID=3002643 RepID=UPI00227DF766|nr:hypothetical protein [Pandoraea sp. XJJ-1]WAL81855.1 hypothetical protein OYT13_18805 [Pandoraea sp. XJJ-1]